MVATSFTSSRPSTLSDTATAFSAPRTTGVSAAYTVPAKTTANAIAPLMLFLCRKII